MASTASVDGGSGGVCEIERDREEKQRGETRRRWLRLVVGVRQKRSCWIFVQTPSLFVKHLHLFKWRGNILSLARRLRGFFPLWGLQTSVQGDPEGHGPGLG